MGCSQAPRNPLVITNNVAHKALSRDLNTSREPLSPYCPELCLYSPEDMVTWCPLFCCMCSRVAFFGWQSRMSRAVPTNRPAKISSVSCCIPCVACMGLETNMPPHWPLESTPVPPRLVCQSQTGRAAGVCSLVLRRWRATPDFGCDHWLGTMRASIECVKVDNQPLNP